MRKRGHYHGKISGEYDEATRKAVVAFQTSHRIPARGSITKRTWAVMMAPGSTPLLKYGSASHAVRRLQRALNAVDGAGLAVSGSFEWTTTVAVRTYQRDHQLPATGVVLDEAWALLQAGVL